MLVIAMASGSMSKTLNLYFKGYGFKSQFGWSGGAMVLGKLPVPGRHTNLDNSRPRAYYFCSRCVLGLFGHFFSYLSFLFFLPLWETARYRLKYCLKGQLSPKATNQPIESPYCCPNIVFSLLFVPDKNGGKTCHAQTTF